MAPSRISSMMFKLLPFTQHPDIAVHVHLEHGVSETGIWSLLTKLAPPTVLLGSSTFPFPEDHPELSLTSHIHLTSSNWPCPQNHFFSLSPSICLTYMV